MSVPGVGEETPLANLSAGNSLRSKLQDRSDALKDRVDETERTKRGTRFEARPVFMSYTALPLGLVLLVAGLISFITNYFGVTFALNASSLYESLGSEPVVLTLTSAPLLLSVLWLFRRIVHYAASTFAVEGNRVELDFTFLNRSVTSLSTDKIKAIVKRQGIIERFFDTYTLIFHSIGTEKNIHFFSLKDNQANEEMLRHIREREGSYGGRKPRTVEPSFSRNGLFQNPGVLVLSFLGIFVPVMILGLVLSSLPVIVGGLILSGLSTYGTVAYLSFYYGHCVGLDLFEDFLVYREGYFITKEYYVVYHDVRNVSYAREPGSDNGWFTVDFASGGQSQQQSSSNDLGALLQHTQGTTGSFTVQHLEDVEATASAIEDVLSESIPAGDFESRRDEIRDRDVDTSERLRATPRGIPYLGMGLLYGLIPLAVIPESAEGFMAGVFLVSVPGGGVLGWLYHKTVSYTIKGDRVESSHWIVFTRSTSIKYKNIDNIETDQNFLGKILRMGTVKVSTTGGSGVEMTAKYLPDYQSFYRELQDEYSEATTSETI